MSLDIWGYVHIEQDPETPIYIYDEVGTWRKLTRAEWVAAFPNFTLDNDAPVSETVFDHNITHNLGKMADAAGFYKYLWRHEEMGIETAQQLIEPLINGIAELVANPDKYRPLSASNGWGTYEQFLPWLRRLLQDCKNYPYALIGASR